MMPLSHIPSGESPLTESTGLTALLSRAVHIQCLVSDGDTKAQPLSLISENPKEPSHSKVQHFPSSPNPSSLATLVVVFPSAPPPTDSPVLKSPSQSLSPENPT